MTSALCYCANIVTCWPERATRSGTEQCCRQQERFFGWNCPLCFRLLCPASKSFILHCKPQWSCSVLVLFSCLFTDLRSLQSFSGCCRRCPRWTRRNPSKDETLSSSVSLPQAP